ncbi:DNA polymerase III subunit chi [Hydrogenophaga sp.]|uniref:DNA polymerase III subunit chi n=1 Tax=Hydrogenophaga sp. TaxID=1904254 RepID=UPI0019A3F9AC|nr:DNA polymerase III subunit chi [Hydrogenophaga sp.]MBD3894023.1 DNA polymerase III subunit chi [Hydrogenophaga sp.]
MTEVVFHFNVPDKQAYACRLLRKGYRQGVPLLVLADEPVLTELDAALWTFAPHEFVPHCRATDPAHVVRHSPIQLHAELPPSAPADAVLVNLRPLVPQGYQRCARLIELVTADPNDRQLARQRWRGYQQDGLQPQKYDLQALARP